jgi:hypothetical protein
VRAANGTTIPVQFIIQSDTLVSTIDPGDPCRSHLGREHPAQVLPRCG